MHQEKDCVLVAHIKNQLKHHYLLLKNMKFDPPKKTFWNLEKLKLNNE